MLDESVGDSTEECIVRVITFPFGTREFGHFPVKGIWNTKSNDGCSLHKYSADLTHWMNEWMNEWMKRLLSLVGNYYQWEHTWAIINANPVFLGSDTKDKVFKVLRPLINH